MKRLMVGTAVIVGLAAGALLSPIGGAIAGHTNTVLEASLDGRAEVDPAAGNSAIAGDPNGRGEVYVFGIDGDPKTLCYVMTVDKIAPATAAHIHFAAAGGLQRPRRRQPRAPDRRQRRGLPDRGRDPRRAALRRSPSRA